METHGNSRKITDDHRYILASAGPEMGGTLAPNGTFQEPDRVLDKGFLRHLPEKVYQAEKVAPPPK